MDLKEVLQEILKYPNTAAFSRIRYVRNLMSEEEQQKFLNGMYLTATGNLNGVTGDQNENIRYTEGSNTYENDDLRIRTGFGVEYPFASNFPHRSWNGTLHYTQRFDVLETTFANNNFQDGNMFNLEAKQHLTLRGFDIHVSDVLNSVRWGERSM